MGTITGAKVLMLLGFLAFCGFLGWNVYDSYRDAIEDANNARNELEHAQIEIESLGAMLKEQEAAALRQQEALKASRAALTALNDEFSKFRRDQQTFLAWFNGRDLEGQMETAPEEVTAAANRMTEELNAQMEGLYP